MWAEFKHTLRRLSGQIIGWSIGLSVYAVMMALIYADIATIDFSAMLESYPEAMIQFFGDSFMAISSPKGYLDLYFFNYMTVIIGIFTVGACAGLLVGSEERGQLDLILAHPISRSALFWGRLLGFTAAQSIILLVSWASWVIPGNSSGMDLTALEFLYPFIPLLAQLLLFGFLAVLLSLLLPAARLAAMVVGGLLVANYLMVGLSNINEDLQAIVDYTPLHFYQGGLAVEGINWGWFLGLMGVALLFALLAWWRFQVRDIRVGGEGGWNLNWRAVLKRS